MLKLELDKSQDKLSYFLLILLGVIWGFSFILIKKILLVFEPLHAACLRLSISSITFLPIILWHFRQIRFRDTFKFFLVGITGSGIPAILFSIAQTKLSSSVSGMLNSLTPIWTLVIGYFVFGLKFNKFKILGVLAGFSGALLLILVSSHGFSANLSYALLIILATLCYGTSVNIVQAIFKETRPIIISAMSFFLIGIPAIAYLWNTNIQEIIISHPQAYYSLGAAILLSVFGTVTASILFYYLVQRTSAIFASMVTYIMPIISTFIGVMDGEPILALQILGMCIVLTGVYLTKK
jgi:drug/metabolite transporter (DMT)-like permease